MSGFKTKKNNKGFTLIEMVIVIAILGIILAIALPNLIEYYWQQRFYQEVQHIVAAFRTAQFTSISNNHWIAIAMHPDCQFDANQSDKFCLQIMRLASGRCSLRNSPPSQWPADWTGLPGCTETNTNTLCEWRNERWIMDKLVVPDTVFDATGTIVYIIGPDGTVTSQTGGDDFRICSSLPIPQPPLQMVFAHPEDVDANERVSYKGICISGRGNIAATNVEKDKINLLCQM